MKYSTNATYFDTWTDKSAYILGFTLADGEVSDGLKKGYGLYYDVHPKDVEILKFIRDEISPTRPIALYTKDDNTTRKRGKQTSYCRLSLTCKPLAQAVMKIGIQPRKTGSEQMPMMPPTCLPHFIRGFFDGDGGVRIRKRNNEHEVYFVSASLPLLESVKINIGELGRKIRYDSDKFRFEMGRAEGVNLRQFMYPTGQEFGLKRKKALLDQF